MTPVSPLTLKASEDERLMMEILRGSPALSAFRINKLLARFQAANLPVSAIYAEYIHFADLNAPLSADDRERGATASVWPERAAIPRPVNYCS